MTVKLFHAFADPLPEPMVLVGNGGRTFAVNPSFTEKFGPHGDQNLVDLVTDSPAKVKGYLTQCHRSRSVVLGALQVRGADGAIVPCRCEGARLAPRSGKEDALVFIRFFRKDSAVKQFEALNKRIRDLGAEIQARQRAEQELGEREEWLRVTLASIADGVIVTDANLAVRSVNPVAESLTGWAERDAVGKPLTAVYRIVDEKTRGNVEHPIAHALRDEKVQVPTESVLLRGRGDAEEGCPVDHSAAPIRNEAGQIMGAVLVFRDVTERRREERRFAELHERSKFVLEGTGVGCWFNELPLGALDWDARTRELFFVPPDVTPTIELFFERLHPEDREPTREAADIAIRDRSKYAIEHRAVDPETGVIRWILSKGQASYDAAGQPFRFDGINIDITSQKEAEAELRTIAAEMSEVNNRKNEFLAMLAHELRNPLAPLRTGLEILKMAEGKDAAMRAKTREMMERQVVQLVVLIDDLMDVSRISRGKLDLKVERLDLREIIQSACEQSGPTIEAAGHAFEASIPESAILVEADPHRLAQVLSNLLNNAAKYTHSPGRISLAVVASEDAVEVAVRDNGIGIALAKQDRIFEMFTQIDRATQRGCAGLGIGLTIVKSLTEMHGGTVRVSSAGEGQGSEFTIRLPIAKPQSDAIPAHQGDERAVVFRKLRVLVVDDNPEALESLETMVAMYGHEVRSARDGREAVRIASEYAPEVVFMDLGMPVMSGFEAARLIRKNGGDHRPFLVAVSGWGADTDRTHSDEAGFDRHLVKPASPAVIREILLRTESGATD